MARLDTIIAGLRSHGLEFVEIRRVSGQPIAFAIFRNVAGKSRVLPEGKIPLLAVPLPDDEQLPPPGFHMSPPIGKGACQNVHDSPLTTPTEEWIYWSRPFPPGSWSPQSPAERILSHLNSALRDA